MNTAIEFNFYNYEDEYFEQDQFLNILYHDAKNGNAVRVMFKDKNKKTVTKSFASKDLEKIRTTSGQHNTYTSVNTFKGYRRLSAQIFNYSGIFIDLDCHDKNMNVVDKAISKTEKRLVKAFANGEVSIPTMITATGRGMGLFYILDRSIANVKNAKKQIDLLKSLTKSLMEKYQNILDSEEYLKVDTTVSDGSRICRLPLTYNTKAKRWCRLVHVEYDQDDEVKYYSLKELKEENQFERAKQLQKKIARKQMVYLDEYRLPFLSMRLQQLSLLQQLRGNDCTSYREFMLFIYHNAAKQIYGRDALEKTKEFNNHFINPLPLSELDNTIKGINENVAETGDYEGYYKISDAWIVEKLEITEEEQKQVAFFGSKRKIERRIKKEQNQEKRKNRRKEIADYLKEHRDITYPEVALYFGVSESTVFKIAKEYNIRRYKVNDKAENEIAAEPASKPISFEKERLTRVQRNEMITEFMRSNPTLSAREVAEHFDVKVSLVYNIARSNKSLAKYENRKNLSQSIYVVPSAHLGELEITIEKPAHNPTAVLGEYLKLYDSVTRRSRRTKAQVPGQIGFTFTDQGVEYFTL